MTAMTQTEADVLEKISVLLQKPEDRPPSDQIDVTFDPAKIIKDLEEFYELLKESDAMLKASVPYLKPPHYRPELPAHGEIEFGILPFWAKYPKEIPDYQDIPQVFLEFLKLVDGLGLIPQPTLTPKEYEHLKTAVLSYNAISPDGTSWGIGNFGQLDYRWLEAPINMLLVNYYYKKYPWPMADLNDPAKSPHVATIPEGGNTFVVAGDWGTGGDDAKAVRHAAVHLDPYYLFHLGDVYYTGTPQQSPRQTFLGPGYEMAHLVDFWPKTHRKPGRSFTMNSNHEMYTGARGLFEDALSSPIFAHQNGFTYGMLENEFWQVFYLDSAYYSPDFLKMYGALSEDQISFVKSKRKGNTDKKTIVMTHHTPFDVTGKFEQVKNKKSLLRDVARALDNNLPDYWYFGHIHDGIAYAPKKVVASKHGPKIPGTCHMRCTGHASMPYGAPWALAKLGSKPPFKKSDFIKDIEFFAQTPKPDCGLHVKNGFMTFTFTGANIEEAFYDSDGKRTWFRKSGPTT
ncbi:metallophosphoesterase family protein [Ruegeria meonggei]|uniref:metallophosphoesterase family protein n=1 Tax=Ruegeria meonggei TaxID=1446476 RepID=UPI003671373C